MTKENLSDLISKASVKESKLLHPERSFQKLFLLMRGDEAASGIILKEPNSDFTYRIIPEKAAFKIKVAHIWKSQIDVTAEYELLTVSLEEAVPEEEIYTISKAVYSSVLESFQDKDILIGVLHLCEGDETTHFHFLLKRVA